MNLVVSSTLISEYTYLDYSTLTATDIQTYTYNSTAISVDYKRVLITENVFTNSLFGNSKGLVVLKGL